MCIEFDMDAGSCGEHAKFHHQWLPDSIFVEKGFPVTVTRQLENMGYLVRSRDDIGRTEMILVRNKMIIAIGDKRGDDDAEGY